MPGFDQTGPEGNGMGTGRRMGSCYSPANANNSRFGRMGGGRGMGAGRRSGPGRGAGRRLALNRNMPLPQNEQPIDEVSNESIDNYVYEMEGRITIIENKLDKLLEILNKQAENKETTEQK